MSEPRATARTGADPIEPAVAAFREALARLRYGTVAVTVHDARVVQIEITEKRRFGS